MSDKTIYDPGATRTDGSTTILDGAKLSVTVDPCYEKGDTILDTYRVESKAIESGGMGRVWRVRHTGWNVDLAMKRPRAEHFADEKSKLDFIRECDTWIKLGLHPNIVSCYYVRLIDGIPTIFSEWMDGGDLADAIDGGGLYEGFEEDSGRVQERILDIAIQIARGLHYAHEARDENGKPKQIVHQDVKPGNVMLTKDGEAKVGDFGLAKARAAMTSTVNKPDQSEPGASTRSVISPSGGYTPAYCSMEQMDKSRIVTSQTDIYSWAVSVMELYVGSHRWMNGIVAGMECRKYFEMAKVPIPAPMKDLLARCLAYEPEDRPQGFGLILAELRAIYQLETGNPYPREDSRAAADTADSLNNRALSMLDLGKSEEAEKLWERALTASPNHINSMFNHTLHQFQSGKLSSEIVIEQWRMLSKSSTLAAGYLPDLYRSFGDYLSIEELNAKAGAASINPASDLTDYVRRLDIDDSTAFLTGANGIFYISESDSTDIRALDSSTGQILYRLKGAMSRANSIAMSPDCRRLAAGGLLEDKRTEICIFNLTGGTLLCRFYPQLKNCKLKLYFFDNGSKLFSEYIDPGRTLHGHVHDVETGVTLDSFAWYTGDMAAFDNADSSKIKTAFDGANNRILAANGVDGISAYPSEAGGKFTTDHPVKLLDQSLIGAAGALSGDGKRIAILEASMIGGRISVYGLEDGNLVSTIESAAKRIIDRQSSPHLWHLAMNQDGSKLCFITNTFLQVWSVSPARCLFSVRHQTTGKRIRLQFDPQDGVFVRVQSVIDGYKPNHITYDRFSFTYGVYQIPAASLQRADFRWQLSRVKSSAEFINLEAEFHSALNRAKDALNAKNIADALQLVEQSLQIDGFANNPEAIALQKSIRRFCVARALHSVESFNIVDVLHESGTMHASFSSNGDSFYTCYREYKKNRLYQWNIVSAYTVDGSCERGIIGDVRPYKYFACAKHANRVWMAAQEDNSHQASFFLDGESDQYSHIRNADAIRSAAMSDDGGLAAVVGNRCTLTIWNLANKRSMYTVGWDQHRIDALCFSPDNRVLCAGTSEGKILRLDISKPAELPSIARYDTPVVCMRFSPDGKTLLVAFQGKKAVRLDAKTGEEIGCISVPFPLKDILFTSDGKYLLVSGAKEVLCLLQAETGACLAEIKHMKGFKSVDLTNDSSMLLSSGDNGCVHIWKLNWHYFFPGWADWDEGARPHLEIFLTLHPDWSQADFDALISRLQDCGFGWLRPEGVKKKLKELAAEAKA